MNVLSRFLLVCVAAVPFFGPGHAGTTTCVGDALDWYTSVVGESPCMTYQRLRQICNSEYEVASFRPNTPGDNCNDQLSTCCCNSVSWALSMLCMNCQQDINGGDVNGIDAGVGAYEMYLDGCGYGMNQSLPTNIQEAVCNAGIRLDDFLYGLFWNNGAWYYTYTRETAEQDHATNDNNTFTHCESDITSSISQSSTSTQTTATTSPATTKSVLTTSQLGTSTSQFGTSTSQLGTSTSQFGVSTSQLRTSTSPFGSPTSQDTTVTGKASGTSSASGQSDTHSITMTTSAATTETMLTTGSFGTSTIQITTDVAIGVPSATGHSDARSMTGAVVGGAVGGSVALVALLIGTCLIWRRQHRKGPVSSVENDNGAGPRVMTVSPYVFSSLHQSIATASGAEETLNDTRPEMSAFPSSTSQSQLLKDYAGNLYQRDNLSGNGSANDDADGRPSSGSRLSHLFREPLMHDDAGPLNDSLSGTLPPPYQHSWIAE